MQDWTIVYNVVSDRSDREPLYSDQIITIPAETLNDARVLLSNYVTKGKAIPRKHGYLDHAVLMRAPTEGWRGSPLIELPDSSGMRQVITIDVRQEALDKLTADLRKATADLSAHAVRYMVDYYYAVQAMRIRFENQISALDKKDEPHGTLNWLHKQVDRLETEVKKALDTYSLSLPNGIWARSIPGLGPVLTAGLMAHVDIHKAPYAGHIYTFGGIAWGQKWEKGTPRPWNASLKRLFYLIGESFIWVQNKPDDVYGHIYAKEKALQKRANSYKWYKDQAYEILETKNIGKDTKARAAYEQGYLPEPHIGARARRRAVKDFISDLQYVWWTLEFGTPPAKPYMIDIKGHSNYRKPAFWPMPGYEHLAEPGAAVMTPHIATPDELVQVVPGAKSPSDLKEAERARIPMAGGQGEYEGREEGEPVKEGQRHLFVGLEYLLTQFEQAVMQLEALQLPEPQMREKVPELFSYVPKNFRKPLEQRLIEYELREGIQPSETDNSTDTSPENEEN